MKYLIILTLLLSTVAFADQAAYIKLGDIKGETTEKATEENNVVEHAEESAEDVRDSAANNNPLYEEKNLDGQNPLYERGVHQPGNGATGQARRRGDVKMEDISVSKELDKSSTKAPADGNLIDQHRQRATDHNSSRSNKTSSSRKLDTDDDDDSIPTEDKEKE